MSRPFATITPLGQEMERQGWTLTEFSAVSGVHPRTISEYLSGRAAIKYDHLLAFADSLSVEADELVFDPVDVLGPALFD